MIDGAERVASEFAALWPIQRFPVLVDDAQFVFEATGITEYLEVRFPETARLVSVGPMLAAEVWMWDRFFDNYVSYPQGRCSRLPTRFATAAWPVGPGQSERIQPC